MRGFFPTENQQFFGRGLFGQTPQVPTPVGANLVIRSTAGALIADVAAGGAPADQITGDFSTIIGLVPDLFFRVADSGADLQMIAFCSIHQNSWTSIDFLDFGKTFKSADAAFSPGCGTNSWTWVGGALGLQPTTVYSMQVTP